MNNFHYNNMASVLVWFMTTFTWIRQFNPLEWDQLSAMYEDRCKVCNQYYLAGEEIYWKGDVGKIHKDCFRQLIKLEQFLANDEADYSSKYDTDNYEVWGY